MVSDAGRKVNLIISSFIVYGIEISDFGFRIEQFEMWDVGLRHWGIEDIRGKMLNNDLPFTADTWHLVSMIADLEDMGHASLFVAFQNSCGKGDAGGISN